MDNLLSKDELKQRHVEAFFKHMRALNPDGKVVTGPEQAGVIVRAAAHSGILSIREDAVDEMAPGEVVRLASDVNKLIAEALDIPKN